jgi:hypothetical protein
MWRHLREQGHTGTALAIPAESVKQYFDAYIALMTFAELKN